MKNLTYKFTINNVKMLEGRSNYLLQGKKIIFKIDDSIIKISSDYFFRETKEDIFEVSIIDNKKYIGTIFLKEYQLTFDVNILDYKYYEEKNEICIEYIIDDGLNETKKLRIIKD